MLSLTKRFFVIAVGLVVAMVGWAQAAPMVGSSPGSLTPTPASGPARRVIPVPEGFTRLSIGGVQVLCESGQEAWIRTGLANLGPATRPTTMPSDLLARLTADRAKITAEVAKDLALADDKSVQAFLDGKLIASLKKLDAMPSTVFYITTTPEKLKALVQSGWGGNQFYYNRVADQLSWNLNMNITAEGQSDDMVVPCLYHQTPPTQPADQAKMLAERGKSLAGVILQNEQQRLSGLSVFAQRTVYGMFTQMIGETAIEPLKLQRDQYWMGMGFVSLLAAKYTSMATGLDRLSLVRGAAAEDQRNPIRAGTINLLKPTPESALRAEAQGAYLAAMRVKATVIAHGWVTLKGEDLIPKMLAAVRTKKPATGEDLVKLAKEITGQDLTPDLTVR